MRHSATCQHARVAPTAVVLAALAAAGMAEAAADAGPSPGVDTAPTPFRAEPVAVDQPVTLPAGVPAAEPARLPAAPLPGAGTGWLGMTADDGLVTGRVSVVDVAAQGPAAQAGIRPNDLLLELDGKPLRNDEDLAAALAAIAPGQRVTAAVGRDGRIEDVVLTAGPRPADQRTRPWPDRAAAVAPAAAAPGAANPAGLTPAPAPVSLPPLAQPAAAPLAPTTPAAPIPAGPRLPERSVLVPTDTAPAAVVPVAGAQSIPVPAPAAAVPAASPWATAPTAAPPALRSAPAVAAVAPAAVAPAGQPPVVMSPPVAAGVSAWGGNPAPAAVAGPPVVSRGLESAGLPAAGLASAATPSRVPTAAAPGRLALGVRTVPVDGSVQSRFRLADSGGALVIGVVHDLPASRAGVPPGSVIVALDNVPVRSPQELTRVVSGGTPGVPLPIQYVLPGGEARRADVVLVPLEPSLERALAGSPADTAASQVVREPAPALARRVTVPPGAMPGIVPPGAAQPATANASTGSPSSPAPAAMLLTGVVAPQPDVAPLERLEAILRRLNERLEAVEGRLERIERGGR